MKNNGEGFEEFIFIHNTKIYNFGEFKICVGVGIRKVLNDLDKLFKYIIYDIII